MSIEKEPGTCIKLENVPSGQEHLEMIEWFGDLNRRATSVELNNHGQELRILGMSLSIIYQVAICHKRCSGGPHVYESLLARTYNLACSAYHLIGRGLYDEALNLVRSIGEIANLFGLFWFDNEKLTSWLFSDESTRKRNFKPVDIRKSLEKVKGGAILYANQDWYSKFCEEYTHVHPGTKPNVHNEQGQGHAGGHVQDKGLKYSLSELTDVCAYIALFASQYGRLNDLFKELREAVGKLREE